ncbi:MAG TPA: PAS domain S-box protein [Mucilaginibacter sp.]|nr:PAS domain S-box protein [Mucilaginibacter sp.]
MTILQKNRTITVISCIAIATGIVVMCGWLLNIPILKQIIPGFVNMVFNSALVFVLFAGALLSTQYPGSKYQKSVFLFLSSAGTLVGLVTLLQFAFSFNSGLDELFIKDHEKVTATHLFPGRMAFNSAVSFTIFGFGLIVLSVKKRAFDLFAQWAFHLVTIISVIALIGYLYGVSLFDTLLYVSSMAAHTAILFFILSIAASLLNPQIGITSLFTGKLIGNQMAKRLFTLMFVMVIIFGSLRVQTEHYKLFPIEIGVSLLAVCFLLMSLAIIWNTALWLNRVDADRSKAEAEVIQMNAELEKRVEERSAEYQKSEEKYRSLIEHASDAIYVLDVNGYFTDVNASMCKMMGYTRDELLKLNVEAIVDPEELKIDPLPKSMKGAEYSEFRERCFMRKSGEIFPVEINVKRFMDDRVLVMARDITYRKKMETELRDAELKFRTVAEKSIVGVYIVQNGKFVFVNPRFAEIFGYQPDEIINTMPVDGIIHDSYKHVTIENVRKRIDGEVESVHYEAIGLKKDGSANWVEFFGSRAIIGGLPTIIGSMVDITKRKAAEEELRSSERQYKLLFESNPLPLWMVDKETMRVIAANDAAAELYGYAKDELLDMSITAFRIPEDRHFQMREWREDMTSVSERNVLRHVKKDGTVMFVQVVANDIIFEGRPVRLSLTHDITERLKAEDALRKSEANLQTILTTTDTAYASFDTDFKLLAFNPTAFDFISGQYHHTPKEGDYLGNFIPSYRWPKLMDMASQVLTGDHFHYEIDYPQDDGSIQWYDVKLSPLTDGGDKILGMLVALYNITERKNAEYDLQTAYVRIQDHVDSIKGMAWKQSHLIRSPLANLKALSEMLQGQPMDTELLKHFQTELNRLDDIIHEMAREAAGHDIEN